MQYVFHFDTSHFQFYFEDLAVAHDTSDLWDAQADPLLQARDGLLAVGTARWGRNTTVSVEVHASSPQEAYGPWEHVREARIRTTSRRLHLTTPEGDDAHAPAIALAPGTYHVRVYYGRLSSVTDELAPYGEDWYTVLVWPS